MSDLESLMRTEIECLTSENRRLIDANRHCVDWFNALKQERDLLLACGQALLDALDREQAPGMKHVGAGERFNLRFAIEQAKK